MKNLPTRIDAKKRRENPSEFGIDVIGDIAVLRLQREAEKKKITRVVLAQIKNVKCVYEQRGGIEGELRLRSLVHLGGERRTLTTHKENGCAFRVDVARCYFSPRLATERLRVVEATASDDRVLNMFAGVGPFSIEIAKRKGARVTSCELNPLACELHRENNLLNKVDDRVEVIQSDARLLPETVSGKFDRILMPHPSAADGFIDVATRLLQSDGVIHYYRHLLARNEREGKEGLDRELSKLMGKGWSWEARRVREVGPRWMEMTAEIRRV